MLNRTAPEAQGIPSAAIERFVDAMAQLDSPHSFMLLRHGNVVAEGWWKPYRPEAPHLLFSLSKSFTSCAVGLAREEGLLGLDDPVAKFFPAELTRNADPRCREMTIRHLLTMATGHDRCALEYMTSADDWAAAFFQSPLAYRPGERFVYNSGATYMLSALLRRITGQSLTAYLRPRLLEPLGFGERNWETCPKGIEVGGWGFYATTEELARFAQMLLQGGEWRGRQLVPADYLKMATSFQIDNSMNDQPDWRVGYGFQFWRCRHNAFRGDGAFGQYALVMPEQDAALAITSGLRNMQQVLDLVWKHLLPAMSPAPLPADPAAAGRLAERIARLTLPVLGTAGRPLPRRSYRLNANEAGFTQLELESGPESCRLTLTGPNGPETVLAGFGHREESVVKFDSQFPHCVAASAEFTDDRTLTILASSYNTPYQVRLVCRFDDECAALEHRANLTFLSGQWPLLTGRRV